MGGVAVQTRGGEEETPQVTELLQLARQYEGLDWRAAAEAGPSNRLWAAWQATYMAGEVPAFSHVAPRPVPLPADSIGSYVSGTLCTPGLSFTCCAFIDCGNMAGLSERGLKTYACGGCMAERYCSKACQRRAHRVHKQHCGAE